MNKMFKRMMAMVSLGGFCAAMCPALPANAEETIVKNFEYYQSLSDYEVYVEYCETYGFEAEETMPVENKLPYYSVLKNYVYPHSVWCTVYCTREFTEEDAYLNEDMSFFGFPEEWVYYTEDYVYNSFDEIIDTVYTPHPVVGIRQCQYQATHNGVKGYASELNFHFSVVGKFESDYEYGDYEDTIVNIYRIILTLNHSEFVTTLGAFGKESIYFWPVIGEIAKGDANSDDVIDARDAAKILYYAALMGANPEEEADSIGINLETADVNVDEAVNAKDAAVILRYSAAAGVGYEGTLEEYMTETES